MRRGIRDAQGAGSPPAFRKRRRPPAGDPTRRPLELNAQGADQLILAGVADANLKELEELYRIQVVLRGDSLRLTGRKERVREAANAARHMIQLARLGRGFGKRDIRRFASSLRGEAPEDAPPTEAEERGLHVAIPGARRVVAARSEGQEAYLRAMADSDIVIAIGPAGTGKTYLAVACAVNQLFRKRVRRVILARPAVEAGESLGFLPGDMKEKVDPYLRPLYDALGDMMSPGRMRRGLDEGVIEIAPLAFMRGRTLEDAFVILDEAQNATAAQMKMFLTRIGVNSRVVITGDATQIDLPPAQRSGLIQIEELLRGVKGIEFVYLTEKDVARHRLVRDIIRAYQESDAVARETE